MVVVKTNKKNYASVTHKWYLSMLQKGVYTNIKRYHVARFNTSVKSNLT